MSDPIRSIRARARAIFAAAGVQYATSEPSRIRGVRRWSSGVIINACPPPAVACVVACYDIADVRRRDLAAAVKALRSAGWTVADDGQITEVTP